MTMTLIGTYLSPFARRVGAALIARDLDFRHDDLNGYADPGRARALNPVGKVPILELDDGERLFDSAAILDHIDELVGPARALVPPHGPDRRTALRLAAIATTVSEQASAHFFETRRSGGAQPALLERYRLQIAGGLQALDVACRDAPLDTEPLGLPAIGAVVAVEFLAIACPDVDVARPAPALARTVAALQDLPAFARTRPQLA
jgi:glutathione S-transferase